MITPVVRGLHNVQSHPAKPTVPETHETKLHAPKRQDGYLADHQMRVPLLSLEQWLLRCARTRCCSNQHQSEIRIFVKGERRPKRSGHCRPVEPRQSSLACLDLTDDHERSGTSRRTSRDDHSADMGTDLVQQQHTHQEHVPRYKPWNNIHVRDTGELLNKV